MIAISRGKLVPRSPLPMARRNGRGVRPSGRPAVTLVPRARNVLQPCGNVMDESDCASTDRRPEETDGDDHLCASAPPCSPSAIASACSSASTALSVIRPPSTSARLQSLGAGGHHATCSTPCERPSRMSVDAPIRPLLTQGPPARARRRPRASGAAGLPPARSPRRRVLLVSRRGSSRPCTRSSGCRTRRQGRSRDPVGRRPAVGGAGASD